MIKKFENFSTNLGEFNQDEIAIISELLKHAYWQFIGGNRPEFELSKEEESSLFSAFTKLGIDLDDDYEGF